MIRILKLYCSILGGRETSACSVWVVDLIFMEGIWPSRRRRSKIVFCYSLSLPFFFASLLPLASDVCPLSLPYLLSFSPLGSLPHFFLAN